MICDFPTSVFRLSVFRFSVFLFSVSLCTAAERFTLSDPDTGETFGPYELVDGTTVAAGGRTFVLRRTGDAADRMTEKLKSIVIPSLEFRNAALPDVVAYLTESSMALDPEQEGVNLVVLPAAEPKEKPVTANDDPFSADFFAPVNETSTTPAITLNLRRISLYDVILLVAEVSGYSFHIDASGAVILKEPERRPNNP